MNPLTEKLVTGTVGELLVQLRLLQYGVQAVATHKDSGNDLLATRDDVFRALQVKATRRIDESINFDYDGAMRKKFHILALVFLDGEADRLDLDLSETYLLTRDDVTKGYYTLDELDGKELDRHRVETLFTGQLRAF
jgi:hypothetical protein